MLPDKLKETLGIKDFGLPDYEVIKKIEEAKENKQKEIIFNITNLHGKKEVIKIKLNYLNKEGITNTDVWGW